MIQNNCKASYFLYNTRKLLFFMIKVSSSFVTGCCYLNKWEYYLRLTQRYTTRKQIHSKLICNSNPTYNFKRVGGQHLNAGMWQQTTLKGFYNTTDCYEFTKTVIAFSFFEFFTNTKYGFKYKYTTHFADYETFWWS